MARNYYFTEKVRSEQLLYEDLVIEAFKVFDKDQDGKISLKEFKQVML